MVRFRHQKPVGIYYSQHQDGAVYGWHDAAVERRDERACTRR